MDDLLRKLIIRLWQYSRQYRLGLGQTRLAKLLYLIEWDYYAWHRERLTSLDWIFLHYGPWSSMLSDLLAKEFKTPNDEAGPGCFRPVFWTPPEHEDVNIRLDPGLEGTVQRVLETFGAQLTSEIIRYVYFNTEPMRAATRGQPLRFESTRKPIPPLNVVKTLDRKVRESLRAKFRDAVGARLAERRDAASDAPVELAEAFSAQDCPGEFGFLANDIRIDPNDRLNLAEQE